ncbi:hypothetical protein [Mucilaginibacter sp.]
MIGNFTAEAGGITFEFITQHTVKLYGFQMYATHEQKKLRFPVQVRDAAHFTLLIRSPARHLPRWRRNYRRQLSFTASR